MQEFIKDEDSVPEIVDNGEEHEDGIGVNQMQKETERVQEHTDDEDEEDDSIPNNDHVPAEEEGKVSSLEIKSNSNISNDIEEVEIISDHQSDQLNDEKNLKEDNSSDNLSLIGEMSVFCCMLAPHIQSLAQTAIVPSIFIYVEDNKYHFDVFLLCFKDVLMSLTKHVMLFTDEPQKVTETPKEEEKPQEEDAKPEDAKVEEAPKETTDAQETQAGKYLVSSNLLLKYRNMFYFRRQTRRNSNNN